MATATNYGGVTTTHTTRKSLGAVKYFQSKHGGGIIRRALRGALDGGGSITSMEQKHTVLPSKMPIVKLDSLFGDGRKALEEIKKQNLEQSFKKVMLKGSTAMMPPYNHYQRPMSQALDKRAAVTSSIMSTQRTSEKIGEAVDLKPQICSIPLIDK